MTRPKTRRMWAIKGVTGDLIIRAKHSKRRAKDLAIMYGPAWTVVRVSVTELHPRKKARRG